MYMNNSVLNNRTSYQVGMYHGEEYGGDNNYWSATDDITKKEFDAVLSKSYVSKDMSEIKFDMWK